jgi:predicted phosphodiesterase
MRIQLKKKRVTNVLVLPDIHYPFEDRRAMTAVENYMAAHPWDALVYLGDVMDFNCISFHNKDNIRAVTGQTLEQDYRHANFSLNRHAQLVGPHCEIAWLQGNHDERVERVINANPVMQGQLEVENNIDLIKSGRMKYVKCWQTGEGVKIGKALYIHGLYCNEFHAKTHVMNYGTNVFYGHTHTTLNYPKIWAGAETIIAQSLGCLCALKQDYMRGRPTKWMQAFGIFHFFPDGNFTYYVPMIFNHKFVGPDGKVYKG